MSLVLVISNNQPKFFLFPERYQVVHNLSGNHIELYVDHIIATKNGLITKYNLQSGELFFVLNIIQGVYQQYQVYPPYFGTIQSFDVIYI